MKKRILSVLVVLIACGAAIGAGLYEDSLVYKVCHVEAGVNVSPSDFLRGYDGEATFADDSDKIDTSVPGEYNIKIKLGTFVHSCTLYVDDTIAPQFEVQDLKIEYGETCEASDFVTSISDATATTVAYVTEPDFTKTDTQEVEISVTDAGGNETVESSKLIITSVIDSLTLEAGSAAPSISDFVLAGDDGYFITDIDSIDYNKPGKHNIMLKLYDTTYNVKMYIVDTVAPTFTVKDIDGYAIVKRNPEDFVTSDYDVTEIKYSFKDKPDLTQIGTQKLTIVGTDEGGNQTEHDVNLTLKADTENPVITGAVDRTVYEKASISYKSNVTVTDNCPEELKFNVDASAVNINVAGVYPVTYTATDAAGNTTSVTVTLTVKERVYSESEVNAMADGVLASIINDSMSQYDKALAIFNYVKRHVSYTSYSEKGNWVKAAYEGFVDGRGDCYVYASISKVLLTRAGITNMDIERIPAGNAMHYWNLVDIDDGHGWYHFDTTPRVDHPVIFLWNDAQITAYSNSHNNCHNYDRSKYPVIP
jgi:transglutaminase-like putative cysteine protease